MSSNNTANGKSSDLNGVEEQREPLVLQPGFLSGNPKTTGNGYNGKHKYGDEPEDGYWLSRNCSCSCKEGQRRCCCCKCSWTCAAIVCVVIVVVVGAVIGGGYAYMRSRLTGTASSEDSAEWEAKLSSAAASDEAMDFGTKGATSIMAGKYKDELEVVQRVAGGVRLFRGIQ